MNDLTKLNWYELSALIENRKISIAELVTAYLDRISRLDSGEQGLNSVLELNPDALDMARRLDQQTASIGHADNRDASIYGMPILLKDNLDTGDLLHTSAGSLALSNHRAHQDAAVVARLRAGGAVILGKTNMTEFANRMTENMPGGYSSRGGQVRSAYDSRQDPWGSSTGSAVAVSAGLCAAAMGTDTSNSIVAAAMRNGVVGFRPPIHALSQTGIIPISFTLDTAGPMTRCVADLNILYAALCDQPKLDFASARLAGRRIAVNVWNRSNLPPAINRSINRLVEDLRAVGVLITEVNLPATPNLKEIMKFEFKYAMNRYLHSAGSRMKSLADIIAFNEAHADLCLRYGQVCLTEAQEQTTGTLTDPAYLAVMADRKKQIAAIRETLSPFDACLMCSPNNIAHYTGLPSVALPNGLCADGMPDGIIMTGLDEARLLETASLLETLCPRIPPPLTGF